MYINMRIVHGCVHERMCACMIACVRVCVHFGVATFVSIVSPPSATSAKYVFCAKPLWALVCSSLPLFCKHLYETVQFAFAMRLFTA